MSVNRKILYSKYNQRYKLFCPDKNKRFICFYCGLPAPTVDHVPPLNKVADLLMEYESLNYVKVPSCQECNGLASDYPHLDIHTRQKYIKQKIKKKYLKYIKSADWEDDEIEALGDRLQQHILASMSVKYLVAYRLTYGEETNFKITDLGYMQFDPRKILKYAEVEKWDMSVTAVNENQSIEEVNTFFRETSNINSDLQKSKPEKDAIKFFKFDDFINILRNNPEIENSISYSKFRKNNLELKNQLPSYPPIAYKTKWKGWKNALGKNYKTKSHFIDYKNLLSYDQFKKQIRKSGIKNSTKFTSWRRSLPDNHKVKIPSAPQLVYKAEWEGWKKLLGKNYQKKDVKKINKSDIINYKQFQKLIRESGIKNSTEFTQWRNSFPDSKKKTITSSPNDFYKKEWKGWQELLGENYHSSQKDQKLDYANMPTYIEFISLLRKHGVKKSSDFPEWRKNLPRKLKRITPPIPPLHYIDDWKGWGVLREKFHSSNSRNLPKVLDWESVLSYDEFLALLKRDGIENESDFIRWRENLPKNFKKIIPFNPSLHYSKKWNGWKK